MIQVLIYYTFSLCFCLYGCLSPQLGTFRCQDRPCLDWDNCGLSIYVVPFNPGRQLRRRNISHEAFKNGVPLQCRAGRYIKYKCCTLDYLINNCCSGLNNLILRNILFLHSFGEVFCQNATEIFFISLMSSLIILVKNKYIISVRLSIFGYLSRIELK